MINLLSKLACNMAASGGEGEICEPPLRTPCAAPSHAFERAGRHSGPGLAQLAAAGVPSATHKMDVHVDRYMTGDRSCAKDVCNAWSSSIGRLGASVGTSVSRARGCRCVHTHTDVFLEASMSVQPKISFSSLLGVAPCPLVPLDLRGPTSEHPLSRAQTFASVHVCIAHEHGIPGG